jgi:hypothetical protein
LGELLQALLQVFQIHHREHLDAGLRVSHLGVDAEVGV